ncbi:hypothetical protein BMF89_00085 [Arthrobacter sp. SRS-W-1-2016]|uniref:hypothetical protein n=1 Tax=Arthrobacter sp. SRS-W-1-2016 TaxID=1930254 RepID=UPI000990D73D|nr:hypothetical protein [Arthrobacter sp. SRS-W-1-2016]OOP65284.1 hypothetical protein BMF89_00085 [Arthrobacter sp. SRS-W-1-2016]
MATTEEVRRRLLRISYWFLPVVAFEFVANILSLRGIDSEPWRWIRTIILAAAVTVLCVQVTRFSLWQRDEYWRERGKDPKHPERPGKMDGP